MDYIEEFRHLKKNGKKSSHKAVLLLAIIDMYESQVLSFNEIRYDDTLARTYIKVWDKVLPGESTFYPDVCLPFWYMQSENFWHVIPIRGKESVLSLLDDNHLKPSESMLKECVDYVELDDELYFLMTLPSGRTSMKKALLETYSSLSEEEIEHYSDSADNIVNSSMKAIEVYKSMLSSNKGKCDVSQNSYDEDIMRNFYQLDEDVQILLNIEYYTFLKEHKAERGMFKELCPSVYSLYDKIILHPVSREDLSRSMQFLYENFLTDLKVSLLEEDAAFGLVDSIDYAIFVLQNNIKNIAKENSETQSDYGIDAKFSHVVEDGCHSVSSDNEKNTIERNDVVWSENEDELLSLCYHKGHTIEDMAFMLKRSVTSIKLRKNYLGFENLQEDVSADGIKCDKITSLDQMGYLIDNTKVDGYLIDQNGERVFETDGKLKFLHGKIYRFNYKEMCFTVKDLVCSNSKWYKGTKKIVAYTQSDLYPLLNNSNYLPQIEDIIEGENFTENKIRVDGNWYDFEGNYLSVASELLDDILDEEKIDNDIDYTTASDSIVLKGGLSNLYNVKLSSHDYLWLLAIVFMMEDKNCLAMVSFDNIACMMIAKSWEILSDNPCLKRYEPQISECVEYLIKESKEYMDVELKWSSPSQVIYSAIKDYPMGGIFEDVVDELLESTPFEALKIWLDSSDRQKLILQSANYVNKCLYSLQIGKVDSFIEINPKWRRYLSLDNKEICEVLKKCYVYSLETK